MQPSPYPSILSLPTHLSPPIHSPLSTSLHPFTHRPIYLFFQCRVIQDLSNFVPLTKTVISKLFILFPPAFMSYDEKYIVKSNILLAIRLRIESELCFY